MSGGGGGDYYVPPVRKRTAVSCETLVVETVLMHPNEELIVTLKVGQVLTVHANADGILVKLGNVEAGFVETPQNKQLINCMEAGTMYVAEILEIEDMLCRVKIYALQL